LGTAHEIIDNSGTIVWQGDYRSFGAVMETISLLNNHLRFAGQYFDTESGLHYNYFRDYDPAIGRYLQSDPIGLDDGSNTYAYVANNPLIYTDSTGLIVDTIADVGFVIYDLYRIVADNIFNSCDNLGTNLAALGADVAAVFAPFVTGAGVGVRAAKGAGKGIIAKDGTKITGYTKHGIQGAIGDGGKRAGVKPQLTLDTLKNPKKVVDALDKQGRPSRTFTGESSRIVVNPETGEIISTNPLSRIGAK